MAINVIMILILFGMVYLIIDSMIKYSSRGKYEEKRNRFWEINEKLNILSEKIREIETLLFIHIEESEFTEYMNDKYIEYKKIKEEFENLELEKKELGLWIRIARQWNDVTASFTGDRWY